MSEFQSTLPRRERQSLSIISSNTHSFNPRSREGSDLYCQHQYRDLAVSIHAPAKGATKYIIPVKKIPDVSIHAPAKGATAISTKNSFQFSAEINKLSFYILYFPLFHPLFFLHSTSFVHILECESPYIFMSASYSHFHIITKSRYHLLQFHDQRLCVLLSFDIYFPNNRISGCQRSHQ